jgi:hypothetical protein
MHARDSPRHQRRPGERSVSGFGGQHCACAATAGAQHGGRAAAACNQSCARIAGPGARACQPGEDTVSGRAGGRGPSTGAGRARPGSQSPAGRVAGDRPPAWGPSTRKSQRGEGRLPRGRAAQRARSSVGAQHGALRADIQAAICAESGRKRPGASSGRLQPELRASCFRARAACGRRSQQSPCLISRCNWKELWGSSNYG